MGFLQSLTKLVGLVHFGCAIVKNAYIIFYPTFYLEESIFVTLYAITPISWLLCKDECIVSYCIKKLNNPQYILGEEPHNYKDMEDICSNPYIYNLAFHVNTICQVLSMFIIMRRHQNINTRSFYVAMITKLIYIYDIKHNTPIRKMFYPWFQITMFCSFIRLLIQWYLS